MRKEGRIRRCNNLWSSRWQAFKQCVDMYICILQPCHGSEKKVIAFIHITLNSVVCLVSKLIACPVLTSKTILFTYQMRIVINDTFLYASTWWSITCKLLIHIYHDKLPLFD